MGFIKTPKINVPAAEPAQEELPVKVDEVKSSTTADYNARAKQRKTLMSTVLNKQNSDASSVSADNGLRKTLG